METVSAANIHIAYFWNEVVDDFLNNRPTLRPPLDRWHRSYSGKGRGQVQVDTLIEPYIGNITITPKAVFLGLNPGRAHPEFQSREGVFAEEIRQLGSFQAWAATWPYVRNPWVAAKGSNRYLNARINFMRRWYADAALDAKDMLVFELYPWHSIGLTASLLPDHGIIREFVWEPLAALNTPLIFAFGKDWFPIIEGLKLELVNRLGRGGRPYPSRVASRSVLVARTPTGTLVVAEKHLGSAGPPAADEVTLLKAEIIKSGGH